MRVRVLNYLIPLIASFVCGSPALAEPAPSDRLSANKTYVNGIGWLTVKGGTIGEAVAAFNLQRQSDMEIRIDDPAIAARALRGFYRMRLTKPDSFATAVAREYGLAVKVDRSRKVVHLRAVTVMRRPTSAAESGDPCASLSDALSRAYPASPYTSEEIFQMLERPTDGQHLLANLKIVFDKNLLSQPAFFDDAVLLRLFNGYDVRWGPAGTTEIIGDWLVKPAHTASVHPTGELAGLKVEVGFRRKCISQGPHATNARPTGPYNYHSGYIAVRTDRGSPFSVSTVLRTFGDHAKHSDKLCAAMPRLNYGWHQVDANPLDYPFTYNAAEFYVGDIASEPMCTSMNFQPRSDADPISKVSIRLVEEDGTLPQPPPHHQVTSHPKSVGGIK